MIYGRREECEGSIYTQKITLKVQLTRSWVIVTVSLNSYPCRGEKIWVVSICLLGHVHYMMLWKGT